MTNQNFWKQKEAHEEAMSREVERVMEIMDDHGYEFCAYIDYEYAHQFVKVETTHDGRIVSWIWAVPKREDFKAVLKWFCNRTKFYGVTGYMKYDGEKDVAIGKYRSIPTFWSAEEVDRNYDYYFGY